MSPHFNSGPAGQIMNKIGMNTMPLDITQVSLICGTAPTKIQLLWSPHKVYS